MNVLLTSFDTWMSHQVSNSSDDLLAAIENQNFLSDSLVFLRKLPVNTEEASQRVCSAIEELKPKAIVCCGMAESRTALSIESCATCGEELLKTAVSLDDLLLGLPNVEVSHDAGKFVCEGLYYSVLDYLRTNKLDCHCIFVHVPLLTDENSAKVLIDFQTIVQRLIVY